MRTSRIPIAVLGVLTFAALGANGNVEAAPDDQTDPSAAETDADADVETPDPDVEAPDHDADPDEPPVRGVGADPNESGMTETADLPEVSE